MSIITAPPRCSYIVAGSWFVNTINFADGSKKTGILGGSGLFAFCGVLQYTPELYFVGAVGNDTEEWFGPWMRANAIREEGLYVYDAPTTVATMFYEKDGRWHETFEYGPLSLGLDMNCFSRPALREQWASLLSRGETKGVTLATSMRDGIWGFLGEQKKKQPFRLNLELVTTECNTDNYEYFVKEILPLLDMYSLNRPESFSLFGVDSEEKAIEKMRSLGKPCYYRVGERGSYMVTPREAPFMAAAHVVPKEEEIDPTGCGNCSTAAAFYAFCEGYSPQQIASLGNVAAAYNVRQYGVWQDYSNPVRQEALEFALKSASIGE